MNEQRHRIESLPELYDSYRTLDELVASKKDFGTLASNAFDFFEISLIRNLIHTDLKAYRKSPFHNYSKQSMEYPIYKNGNFRVSLQSRSKELIYSKKQIHGPSIEFAFKVLKGEFEIISYKDDSGHLTYKSTSRLKKGDVFIKGNNDEIYEFHPLSNEDGVMLVCTGKILEPTYAVYSRKTLSKEQTLSTQVKDSRLRLYSDYLIESDLASNLETLKSIVSYAGSSELRWSIVKGVHSKTPSKTFEFLQLIPTCDSFYDKAQKMLENETK